MKTYKEERFISLVEGKALLNSDFWESIGETTNGYIFWNNQTGELLYEHRGEGYDFVEKISK